LLSQQTSTNSPNGGGIGDLGGRRGGGGHYRAWRGSGAWHRNPRDDFRASFRSEDMEPQSSPGSTMAQLSQAPPEHVDVDRGACEESGAEGQFSEHIQGETHVSTVAEEPNLEILGTWQQHRARSPTLCPFDGPWRAVFIQKQGMAITMMWRE
jgi:hypothetical protein